MKRTPSRGVSPTWGSLRVRLAALGFLAGYVPVLVLFGVILVTNTDTTVHLVDGMEIQTTTTDQDAWVTWTVVALGPGAAGAAWWWAGRVVRPIERIRTVAEEIEESDLGRRIALRRGPTEVVSLAASFDAMLERLQTAADTQRRLIEETSHEIRVPLAVLTTNADVLLTHPDPSVDLCLEGLERSRRAAERLRTTVDELLVEARGRARTLDRAPVDLMRLARSVLNDAEVLAISKDMDLQLSGPPTAVGSVDELTVRRALSNLVDNAIRYSPEGSGVWVHVKTTSTEVTVSVSNEGEGIPEHQQRHVFERSWRGRPDIPGNGLGLPIAHQIAVAHGGRLTLTSPAPTGDGCVFHLTLRR